MRDVKNTRAQITLKITNDKKPDIKNFITLNVENVKSKTKARPSKSSVARTDIYTELTVAIEEYPADNLSIRKVGTITKQIEAALVDDANKIIEIAQKSNGDIFGIGRTLHAYHPSYWNNVNWAKEYGNSQIVPHMKVNIRTRGIY
ncbi:hypothetical protein CHH91_07500 [Virgibacillus sp. 7505]|uniref:Ger(x)C family spore germination C-terminal domain-containing protein n=1 Tax=Virgibacillus sp. 7505 TaxID=2022548 RepID=UPI000BA538C3|nr:Ger(x)C family spore germination C-terminal domain-containing protein [Virgibacillus sp. 7505]PAE16732.1 hypothetical protein CHH91_07500 [Virgibacillus sp. 7505]